MNEASQLNEDKALVLRQSRRGEREFSIGLVLEYMRWGSPAKAGLPFRRQNSFSNRSPIGLANEHRD